MSTSFFGQRRKMQNAEGEMTLSVTCGATSPKVRGKQGSHSG